MFMIIRDKLKPKIKNEAIDQIRVFNRAISSSEVTKLYNEIQWANTITTPESYFNTELYSGTNLNQS